MDVRDVGAGDVQCAALAGDGPGCGLPVFLDAAHANLDAAGRQHQFVADRDGAVEYSAGNDGAAAGDGEHAVNRVAQIASRVLAVAELARGIGQHVAQFFDAVAADRGHRQHFNRGERGGGEQGAHAGGDFRHAFGRHAIGLGDHRDAVLDREQIDDVQVLDGLRHDAVVGGHDQHHVVDAAHAGEHVAHEALVAGHVDEADHAAGVGFAVSKAQIDRDAALLFFRQAIGVDAGQRFDERCFAVVDMAGGGDDHADFPGVELKLAKLRAESRFVVQAAQIEYECAVPDMADHRHGQRAKRHRERVGGAAFALGARRDRNPGAGQRIDRQRAAADLARALDRLRRRMISQRRLLRRGNKRCACASISFCGRVSSRNVGSSRTSRSGSAYRRSTASSAASVIFVDAQSALHRVLADLGDQILAADDEARLAGRPAACRR